VRGCSLLRSRRGVAIVNALLSMRFAQPRAMGRKVSDETAIPLCRIHHRLVHRVGNEAAWWKEAGIKQARTCWLTMLTVVIGSSVLTRMRPIAEPTAQDRRHAPTCRDTKIAKRRSYLKKCNPTRRLSSGILRATSRNGPA
jgi:hypothetical protein